jgi:hypothetical protein
MGSESFRYEEFAEHPRYGRGPRITGLKAKPSKLKRLLSWITQDVEIAGTGVRANPELQRLGYGLPFEFYFDRVMTCDGCGKQFLFFAQEQKYWYETRQFILYSRPRCCAPCRRVVRQAKGLKERYDKLLAVQPKSVSQLLELAEICLQLMELGSFTAKKTDFVRQVLNTVRESQGDERAIMRLHDRLERL